MQYSISSHKMNGYQPDYDMRLAMNNFDRAVFHAFPYTTVTVEHFMYGANLDMVTVIVGDEPKTEYGHFNVTAKSVHFNGHTCSHETYAIFDQLTLNDDCHKGGLI